MMNEINIQSLFNERIFMIYSCVYGCANNYFICGGVERGVHSMQPLPEFPTSSEPNLIAEHFCFVTLYS